MSATEIPVLDPKNIIRHKFIVPADGDRPELSETYHYDPVAKIIIQNDIYGSFGGPTINLFYWPQMDEEEILQALIDGHVSRPFQVNFGYEFEGKTYDADVLFAYFDRGPRWQYADEPYKMWSMFQEGEPGFEFWPKGVPGRAKANIPYFLHATLFELRAYAEWTYKQFLVKPKKVAIAIDATLLEHAGLENFPNATRRRDGAYVLLEKGIENAV